MVYNVYICAYIHTYIIIYTYIIHAFMNTYIHTPNAYTHKMEYIQWNKNIYTYIHTYIGLHK